MKRVLAGFLLAAAALSAAPALAHDPVARAGDVVVFSPWSRATAPSAPNGAAYMMLSNEGRTPDRLLSAASPIADRVELHTHLKEDGVMKMRPVDGIDVEPGAPAMLQPGGLHVMFLGLKQPLKQGEAVPLTLTFERGGPVTVSVPIQGAGAMQPAGHAHGEAPKH